MKRTLHRVYTTQTNKQTHSITHRWQKTHYKLECKLLLTCPLDPLRPASAPGLNFRPGRPEIWLYRSKLVNWAHSYSRPLHSSNPLTLHCQLRSASLFSKFLKSSELLRIPQLTMVRQAFNEWTDIQSSGRIIPSVSHERSADWVVAATCQFSFENRMLDFWSPCHHSGQMDYRLQASSIPLELRRSHRAVFVGLWLNLWQLWFQPFLRPSRYVTFLQQ